MNRALPLLSMVALLACDASELTLGGDGAKALSEPRPLERGIHLTAMAPLVIGRLDAPFDASREWEWQRFASDLAQAKHLGIDAVSLDVWWGAVERDGDQQFDWRWTDRVVQAIRDAGLGVRPVLAFHACGGNVGDTCQVPLPGWVAQRYLGAQVPGVGTVQTADDLFYRSAQGHVSREALSVWVTPLVLEQYREFVEAFVTRYGALGGAMHGIAVGLGSASELRYPSYNGHDQGAGYPGPGVLQAYSPLARESFRRWALAKHGAVANVAQAWGRAIASEADVALPEPAQLDGFFARGEHFSAYGRDVFAWYRGSLLEHGRQVLEMAASVVQASPLRGTRLTARMPGVHWRAADSRRAELSAGLISTSDSDSWGDDARGHGYQALVSMVAQVRARADRPNVALDYTCLEMGNGEGGPGVGSMAEALVFWVAGEAKRQGVPVGGENALNGGLWTEYGWARIGNALRWSHYDELTLLRVTDVVNSNIARREVWRLSH